MSARENWRSIASGDVRFYEADPRWRVVVVERDAGWMVQLRHRDEIQEVVAEELNNKDDAREQAKEWVREHPNILSDR